MLALDDFISQGSLEEQSLKMNICYKGVLPDCLTTTGPGYQQQPPAHWSVSELTNSSVYHPGFLNKSTLVPKGCVFSGESLVLITH